MSDTFACSAVADISAGDCKVVYFKWPETVIQSAVIFKSKIGNSNYTLHHSVDTASL